MSVPDHLPPSFPPPNLSWLFGLQRFGARAGLGTMRRLLERLGDPQDSFRSVVVGGTNGKGSVARLLAAALQADGRRTGLYTSPHLQRVGERARVDGAAASDAEMEALIGEVRPAAEEVEATFFEVITAAALLRFARLAVEWAVLEVGMGGRLDATNVVEPALTVVTSVALDHTAILGDTVAAVAREKAGIMRPGVPLVTAADGDALMVLRARAAELDAPLLRFGETFIAADVRVGWEGVAFELRWHDAPQLPPAGALRLTSPLVGRHQVANVALAATAALTLDVPARTVQRALATERWPGRLERFEYRGRHVVLDGAHNPQAAQALAAALSELEGTVALLVLGVSQEKDVAALLGALQGVARDVLFTRAVHSPRATPPEELQSAWRAVGGTGEGRTAPTPADALEHAVALTEPGDTVVVAGSLFLVGEARNVLQGLPGEPFERWQ